MAAFNVYEVKDRNQHASGSYCIRRRWRYWFGLGFTAGDDYVFVFQSGLN